MNGSRHTCEWFRRCDCRSVLLYARLLSCIIASIVLRCFEVALIVVVVIVADVQ